MEARVARLEATVEHIQTDVSEIKADLRRLDDKLDRGFEKVGSRFDAMREKTTKDFRWLAGIGISVVVALVILIIRSLQSGAP